MINTRREKILYVTLVVAVFVFLLVYLRREGIVEDGEITGFFMNIASVIFGAIYAFLLSDLREKGNKNSRREEKLNYLRFTLKRLSVLVAGIYQGISEYDDDFELAFSFPHLSDEGFEILPFDYEGLSFLLKSSDPDLILDLSLEYRAYESLRFSLINRVSYFKEAISPYIQESEAYRSGIRYEGDISDLIPEPIIEQYVSNAAEIRDMCKSLSKSLSELNTRIYMVCRYDYSHLDVVL